MEKVCSTTDWMGLSNTLRIAFEQELAVVKNKDISDQIRKVPYLMSILDTVASLRGQDGAFFDIRPPIHGELQNTLYSNESACMRAFYEYLKSLQALGYESKIQDVLSNHFIHFWFPKNTSL